MPKQNPNKPPKLTALQERVALAWIAQGYRGLAKAYRAGGGNASTDVAAASAAHDIINLPKVAAFIEKYRQAARDLVQITTQDVVADLIEIKDKCAGREGVAVTVSRKKKQLDPTTGEQTVVYEDVEVTRKIFDAAGANRSLELLGRHTGGFDIKQPHTVHIDPIHHLLTQVSGTQDSLDLVKK